MRELTMNESQQVSGGWVQALVMAVFVYDAVTDFAEGFAEGFEESGGYKEGDK